MGRYSCFIKMESLLKYGLDLDIKYTARSLVAHKSSHSYN